MNKSTSTALKIGNILVLGLMLILLFYTYWFHTDEDMKKYFSVTTFLGGMDTSENSIYGTVYNNVTYDNGMKINDVYWAVDIIEAWAEEMDETAFPGMARVFQYGAIIVEAMIIIDLVALLSRKVLYLTQIAMAFFYLISLWLCHRYNGMLKFTTAAYVVGCLAIVSWILKNAYKKKRTEEEYMSKANAVKPETVSTVTPVSDTPEPTPTYFSSSASSVLNSSVKSPRVYRPQEMKTCPGCGNKIKVSARFCSYCGVKVEEEQVETQGEEQEKNEDPQENQLS